MERNRKTEQAKTGEKEQEEEDRGEEEGEKGGKGEVGKGMVETRPDTRH